MPAEAGTTNIDGGKRNDHVSPLRDLTGSPLKRILKFYRCQRFVSMHSLFFSDTPVFHTSTDMLTLTNRSPRVPCMP